MSLVSFLACSLNGRARRALLRVCRAVPGPLSRLATAVVAERIVRGCALLQSASDSGAPRVLVFQAGRFPEDLRALARHGGLTLIEAPLEAIQEANGLFRSVPAAGVGDDYDYFLEEDPGCLAERSRQLAFCREVLEIVRGRLAFDCAMTPAVHYRGDFPWAGACEELGVPFVALHKEFTVIDERHLPERIELYRKGRFRFQGSWVLVTNESARKLFTEGRVFDPERIEVTGLPRMDQLFEMGLDSDRQDRSKQQVTLFSFAHYCGGLGFNKERRSRLFSKNDDEGFVRLFDAVHGAIAELAARYPNVTFKIKPKAPADWWKAEIDRVFRARTGKTTKELPNCAIVSESAADLIRNSDVVIGFNSTVLLESLALRRPTIMPYFAEAAETYPYNVYLSDFLEAFTLARSEGELTERIEAILERRGQPAELTADERHRCLTYYLGFDDPGSAERVVAAVRRVVARYRDGAAPASPVPAENAA